jgi:hypothetical protein
VSGADKRGWLDTLHPLCAARRPVTPRDAGRLAADEHVVAARFVLVVLLLFVFVFVVCVCVCAYVLV